MSQHIQPLFCFVRQQQTVFVVPVDWVEWNKKPNVMLTLSQTADYSNYEVTELSNGILKIWFFFPSSLGLTENMF